MMAKFEIIQAGPFVSIQDKGRPGFMKFGVPHSGPMDRTAFTILGAALDLEGAYSAIEVSVGGLVLKCVEGAVTAGFIGGAFALDLDGVKLSPWSVFTVEAGMVLTIRPGARGSWGYLGFAGELATAKWLVSSSTLLNSGLCGRPFVSGDRVTIDNARTRKEIECALPIPDFAEFKGNVRAVLGPQDNFFTQEAIGSLQTDSYTITAQYDRMGMRLKGEKLPVIGDLSMLTEPLVRGTIQIPGHGDPIILLADHQTTGGYPKIATVLTADQDRLVQARPHDIVRFTLVSGPEIAMSARLEQAQVAKYVTKIPDLRGTIEEKLRNNNLISGVYHGR